MGAGRHSNDHDDTPTQRATGFFERLVSPTSVFTLALGAIVAIGGATGTLHTGWHWTCTTLLHRCPPPPPHYAIQDYLTDNPARPTRKASTNYELLGISYGTSVSTIAAMFPPEPQTRHSQTPSADKPGDPPSHEEAWEWRGIRVEVHVDNQSGTTSDVYVTRQPTSRYFVSAPNGGLLGHTTAQELIAKQDAEDAHHTALAASLDEGTPRLAFAEVVGGEGLDFITYTFNANTDLLDFDHPYPTASPLCLAEAESMHFETLDPGPDTYAEQGDCAPAP